MQQLKISHAHVSLKRSSLTMLNNICAPFTCHVPIYHATFPAKPSDMNNGLHNVTPVALKSQLDWYSRHFDLVDADQLVQHPNPSGKASITFDDAYTSVFDYALPMLIEMKIPATVFIVGCSLDGKTFWRDKIRYLINNELVEDFLFFLKNSKALEIDAGTFYRKSKSAGISSVLLDNAMDDYFKINSHRGSLKVDNYCINDSTKLIRHPLIRYGNHTYNHYVLPSLTRDQQRSEILKTEKLLDSLNLNRSRLFSLPFGGLHYADFHTLSVIKELKFSGILINGKQLHWGKLKFLEPGLPMIQRYIAPTDMDHFHRGIFSMAVAPIRKKNSTNSER